MRNKGVENQQKINKRTTKELQVLYHLPVLIDRALKCLILWTFTYHIIARQVVEKQ